MDMLMTMTMDLDIVIVIFYQHFLWRFQKHITLGVFGIWKKPSSQARVTFETSMLEHPPPSPPLCPLYIKLSGNFFVRLLDTASGRTADFGARAAFYIGRAVAALDHIKPDGVIIVGRNNGPSEINLKSSLWTHQFDEASTRKNSASARQITSVAGVPRPSLITYHSPLGFPFATTLSYSYYSPRWTAHLARKGTAHLARKEPETKDISLKRQDDIPCSFFWSFL